MGRSKKASRRSKFRLLVVASGLALWWFWEQGDPARFLTTAVAAVWLLVLFGAVWLPTTCDVVTNDRGSSCDNDAYGWLRACHLQAHKQKKRRALLAKLRFRRLAERSRRRWVDPTTPPPSVAPPTCSTTPRSRTFGAASHSAEPVPVELTRSTWDGVVLVATIVGGVASAIQVGAMVI